MKIVYPNNFVLHWFFLFRLQELLMFLCAEFLSKKRKREESETPSLTKQRLIDRLNCIITR